MSEVLDTRYLLYEEKFLPKQTNFLEHSLPHYDVFQVSCLTVQRKKFNCSDMNMKVPSLSNHTIAQDVFLHITAFSSYNSFHLVQQLPPRTTASSSNNSLLLVQQLPTTSCTAGSVDLTIPQRFRTARTKSLIPKTGS